MPAPGFRQQAIRSIQKGMSGPVQAIALAFVSHGYEPPADQGIRTGAVTEFAVPDDSTFLAVLMLRSETCKISAASD